MVERVGSLGTTSRQWDMLIRTLFHDTNERPIRVCIGVCPAPTGEGMHQGRGCIRGGLGEGGKRGGERAAAEEPRPKSQGKTPRGAVQVLLTAWTRS